MKLSWMKLDVNILDNSKIKLIRKYPDGDSLFVLWIALLCIAMKSKAPGVLLISEGSPYTPEDLASVTELEIKTVQMGLELFERFNMIKRDEYNTICVTGMSEYQSFDEIERRRELTAQRVKRHREQQKLLEIEGSVDNVTRYSVTGNATDKIRLDKSREDIYIANKTKRFVKPTVEQVKEYATEIGFQRLINNPQSFIDSNEQKGWVVGKSRTPMKDWKAAIRTWKNYQTPLNETPKKKELTLEEYRAQNGIKASV